MSSGDSPLPRVAVQFSSESFGPPEIRPDELKYFEQIGKGCYGIVFRGECRGKEVAIKKLFKQSLDEKALNEFRKEVEICSRLHHPNILLFMGACTIPGEMAIVTEIMPKGNLEKLIHDPKRQFSLCQRIQMCKDVAMGMSWLHGSNPPIIHRDLKPGNLLVDKYGNIKVCDFGLSAIKTADKLKDKEGAVGSPIWMAPEVMMGCPFDEKSDVYSYSFIIWEIVTSKQPFMEMTSYRMLKRAVCIEHIRPPIPPDMLTSIRQLLEISWHRDAKQRPGFAEIIRMLDFIMIDAAIADPPGQEMWKAHFLGKEYVTWGEFIRPFFELLGIPAPDPEEFKCKCLKAVIATKHPDETLKDRPYVVTVEHFGHFLANFGPLSQYRDSILDRLEKTLRQDWFHGDVSKEDAEALLKKYSHGTFLIRLSSTIAGCFTISKVSREGKVNHQRIEYVDGEFSIKVTVNNSKSVLSSRQSLAEFINQIAEDLHLETPCPGSKYAQIFDKPITTQMEGYLDLDD